MFITNTTAIQNKTAFVEENASNVMMSTISPVDAQNMVAELIKLTNLRADWARKSLEENKWSIDGAFALFQIAKKNGNIPPEAFAFSGWKYVFLE